MSQENKVVYTCTLDEIIQVFEKSPFFKGKSKEHIVKYMTEQARPVHGPYYDFTFCAGNDCNTFRISHEELFGKVEH